MPAVTSAQYALYDAIRLAEMVSEHDQAQREKSVLEGELHTMQHQVSLDSSTAERMKGRGVSPSLTETYHVTQHLKALNGLETELEQFKVRREAAGNSAGSILAPYLINAGGVGLIDVNALTVSLSRNPYLSVYPDLRDVAEKASRPEFMSTKSLGLGAAGRTNVSTVAVGLTDFLIERAKTELNTAFFRRFEEVLKDPKFRDLRTLFPETVGLLQVIGNQLYNYDAFLNSLRAAFDRDLGALLVHARDVVEDRKNKIDLKPGLYPGLMLLLNAAVDVEQGTLPGDVLHALAIDPHADQLMSQVPKATNWIGGLRGAALISESLRAPAGSSMYWLPEQEIRKLMDPTVLRIYLGLLYERSKSPDFAAAGINLTSALTICSGRSVGPGDVPFKELLAQLGACYATAQPKLEQMRTYVLSLSASFQRLQERVHQVVEVKEDVKTMTGTSSADKRKLVFEAYHELVTSFVDLLEEGGKITELLDVDITLPGQYQELLKMVRLVNDLAASVAYKQYGLGVTQLAQLTEAATRMAALGPNATAADTVDGTIQRILKYGTFMAALAEADSPDAAKSAIEAAALPPGSYSIKRESRFSVALNGYVGAFCGHEVIDGADNKTFINNPSLTAPVGISCSWGNLRASDKRPNSLGLMVSLLDLGTIASFRLSDTTTQVVPSISLESLVSPGIFFEWGIGGTPLTLGAGVQGGPTLRKVTSEGVELGDAYVRCGLTLKVDIPIVHFVAVPGKKMKRR
ncbi:MAG: hypothetical protein KDB88_11950 [Flavobacteriales bacterium]|nr:hypothetical protein [Flavobacteriales bacterium]